MPRVSLLLADDVGLGKTMEAGLILSELLLRRRIRRVLILCPAALRHQWQREMHEKFALHFDVVDRKETHAFQRRLGRPPPQERDQRLRRQPQTPPPLPRRRLKSEINDFDASLKRPRRFPERT